MHFRSKEDLSSGMKSNSLAALLQILSLELRAGWEARPSAATASRVSQW